MGLNRNSKSPCGFAFVEHYTAEAALENVARVAGGVRRQELGRFQSDLDCGEFQRTRARVLWLFKTLSIVTRLDTSLNQSQTPTRIAKSSGAR